MYRPDATPPTSVLGSSTETTESVCNTQLQDMADGKPPNEAQAVLDVTVNDVADSSEYTDASTTDEDGEAEEQDMPSLGEHERGDAAAGSQVDEDDLSMFDYAHFNGLTASYVDEDPFQCVTLPSPPESLQADLEDPKSTLSIGLLVALNALNGRTVHEKWDVDKDSAEFLASVLRLGREDRSSLLYEDLDCEAISFTDLKLEEPILASDPELDLLRLKRRNLIVMSTAGMAPFEIDEIKGEGLSWTSKELKVLVDTDREVANEKLDVDREAKAYLKDVYLAPSLTEEEMHKALYRKDSCPLLTPMSPPLMPSSPPFRPSERSGAVGELNFTSTPDDLIAEEVAALEKNILECDKSPPPQNASRLNPDHLNADPMSSYSQLHNMIGVSSSPSPRKRLRDLKADVPLLPLEATEPHAKKTKTVSFPDELHTLIPAPDSDVSILDPQVAGQNLDDFIANVVSPFAESAIQQVDNEQLAEFDTTMRVAVPSIEEVELGLPWKSSNHGTTFNARIALHQATLLQMKRECVESESSWSGVSKIERQLPWSPFPARLGRVELRETFDDGSLARYMAGLAIEDEIDIDSLISRPPRLGAWDADEDDLRVESFAFDDEDPADEPHNVSSPARQPQEVSAVPVGPANESASAGSVRLDMQTLLNKRKMELETANTTNTQLTLSKPNDQVVNNASIAKTVLPSIPTRFSDLATNFGGISSFLNVHRKPVSEQALRQRPTTGHQPSAPLAMMMASNKLSDHQRSLATPIISAVAKPVPMVVSSSLIAQRELFRQIQTQLSDMDVVEREVASSLSASSAATACKIHEADITVSPSTGIIITTLQKLKQKSLPGQSNFYGVHQRIALISLRYSRLILFISEARVTSDDDLSATCALDYRDTEALSDLMGFAATLDCDIETYFVPSSDADLAKWTTAAISHNTGRDESTTLLQDETLWERFLRTAGLNAFASQKILASLKAPETTSDPENSSVLSGSSTAAHGLAALIQLTEKQRKDGFSQSIGEDVLKKISETIDSKWISDAGRPL